MSSCHDTQNSFHDMFALMKLHVVLEVTLLIDSTVWRKNITALYPQYLSPESYLLSAPPALRKLLTPRLSAIAEGITSFLPLGDILPCS